MAKRYRRARIHKPWRIAGLRSSLPYVLNRNCDGKQSHHPCEGPDTLITQGCPSEVRRIIRDCMQKDASRAS
eukprot:9127327-Lingulodinium_polyedra.AAC.1